MSARPPTVAVFGPDTLLSIAVEARKDADDIHLHAAGQGVWVTRMAGELGAHPILCSFLGGESGAALTPLLEALPGELRLTRTGCANGTYIADRRTGEREVLASEWRAAPQRHEVDDLVAATCAAALGSDVLVVCNPFPVDGFPEQAYATIVADVRAAGIPVIVDLSTPRLDRTLPFAPDLVKLNDWELAEYVSGPVDGVLGLRAAQSLLEAGAGAVAVTRGEGPILVLDGRREPYEIVPPRFPQGFREGCGDAMTGAIAASWASGASLRDTLVLGAAAGAGNFLRHGLGTGRRRTIEELVAQVATRPLSVPVSP